MERPGLPYLVHQGHQGGLVTLREAGVELALQVPAAPRATQGEAGQTVVDRPAGDLADGGDDGRHTDSLHAVRRQRVWARSPCRPRGPPR